MDRFIDCVHKAKCWINENLKSNMDRFIVLSEQEYKIIAMI